MATYPGVLERSAADDRRGIARPTLRLTILLGVLVTVMSGTGIFAVFSDRATGGQNTVTSGERPSAADLKIAPAYEVSGVYSCDRDQDGVIGPNDAVAAWPDNLTTAQFNASDVQPGDSSGNVPLCLYNGGASPLNLTVSAIDLLDEEIGCTGDEAASGDPDCGVVPGQSVPGELSSVLRIDVQQVSCVADPLGIHGVIGSASALLSAFTAQVLTGPLAGALAPGSTACLELAVSYPTTADALDQQLAQSDSAKWRFAFDGVAS